MTKPEFRWGGERVTTPKVRASVVRCFGRWMANVTGRICGNITSVLEGYERGGRIPWSRGYARYKSHFIDEVLRDAKRMAVFRDGRALPANFGWRLDERVIEYPWVLSRLRPDGLILDAGSTFNKGFILHQPVMTGRNVIIYTLDTGWITLDPYVSYLFGDLRNTLLRDEVVHSVVCISTLEHIGFGQDFRRWSARNPYPDADPSSYRAALAEFRRLLVPGGQLLLTVPFGRREDHGWLQQFDADGVESIKSAFAGVTTDETYYRYDETGWQMSTVEDCSDLRYYNIHEAKSFDPDYAAAARGVVCLDLRKPGGG